MKDNSYKNAGVNKDAGYEAVDKIKSDVKRTHTENVLNELGDFGALYALTNYKSPILVSGTDGVGTKIMLAKQFDKWSGIGIDCFAMCANDILCHGAKPLFFLDYIACGKLNPDKVASIVHSITNACVEADTALVGGETAEMPGMYQTGDYDVAGFCVGVVEKSNLIQAKKNISVDDSLIGIAASGLHSNGFSLVRHLVKDYNQLIGKKQLIDYLMEPTKIYVKPILELLQQLPPHTIKGMAHITGGGIIENIPRILPQGLCANIDKQNIPNTILYEYIRTLPIQEDELWGTFNMGVGYVIVVPKTYQQSTIDILTHLGEDAFALGTIVESTRDTITIS